jgi:indolepyruvate ferredoxin oxidoreductase
VELNGAAVERNKQAFEMGRWAIVNPEAAERLIASEVVAKPKTLEEKIAFREGHLTAYQGKRLAKRYRKLVDAATDPAPEGGGGQGLSQAAEPTRTNTRSRGCTWNRSQGAGGLRRRFQAEIPPRAADAARQGRRGSPEEARIRPLDRAPLPDPRAAQGACAARRFDVFGYSAERRMERGLIRQYQADMAEFLPKADPETMDALVALAELPLSIRGFGPVKELNARKRRETARRPDRASAGGRRAMAEAAE